MILQVRHRTNYLYTSAVFPEPHHLYFRPAFRDHISVTSFEMEVTPQPKGMAGRLDQESNFFYQCWFDRQITLLEIKAQMTVETEHFNPFNFFVEEKVSSENPLLSAYLSTEELVLTSEMEKWLDSIFNESDHHQLLNSITGLNSLIHDEWSHHMRDEHGLFTPKQCFDRKAGSCRDLSWMMILFLRQKGVPARFVSGYAYNPDLIIGHELHAWVEFFLPGAGWIGIDPSAGLLIDHHYIPVCTSYHPKNTLPVQGTYRGEAESSLNFSVEIEKK
jgi:hypothetical protein